MNNAQLNLVWENYPSETTPINEQRLNSMVRSINLLNENTTDLDTTRATKAEVAQLISDVAFDEKTGIFTFIRKDGSQYPARVWDTKLEQLIENLGFDKETQELIITRADGQEIRVDVSSFVMPNEFLDTDTVSFLIGEKGKVSAIVKEGSIQEKHLRPDYLAEIKIESSKAEASANAARESEQNAKLSEESSAESAESSKSSSETSKAYLEKVEQAGEEAVNKVKDALDMDAPDFQVDLSTGHLMYSGGRFVFNVNNNNGHLEWGLAV